MYEQLLVLSSGHVADRARKLLVRIYRGAACATRARLTHRRVRWQGEDSWRALEGCR